MVSWAETISVICDMLEADGHFYIIYSLQCRVYMSSTEVVFNIERINKVSKVKHRHVTESKTTFTNRFT